MSVIADGVAVGVRVEGNGLGLSMVSAVARLHDMKLTVSDAAPGCRVDLLGTE